MSKIIVLDELTACQIAAGEVIERPASVVKELIENSIDAGASSISVEIKAGGIKYIRVTDNGCGFEADDAVIAFDKHATSKIRNSDDLEQITTLGFRGEALASIAAVADVELLSKTQVAPHGIYVHIKGCALIETGERGAAKGSSITIRDLFYNTPARYKFLKKDSTEASYVTDVMQKLAIANPEISFKLVSNGDEVFRTPGNGDLKSVIFSIFGKETAASIIPVKYENEGYEIVGFAGIRDAVYSNRNRQICYVNGRCIKSKTITAALDEAYKTVTMKNKFPFAVLQIHVPLSKVDVNVHPAKAEVRFSDESTIFKLVFNGVTNGLLYDNRNVETIPAPEPARIPAPVPAPPSAPVCEKYDLPEIWSPAPVVAEAVLDEPAPVQIPIPETPPAVTTEEVVLYNSTSAYTDSAVVGQVFDTYIILQYGDEMILIDQHAAHERIKYEEIKEAIESPSHTVSPMLVPITLQLSPAEYMNLKNNISFFTSMGFEIDDFGGKTVLVRAVPSIFDESDIEDVILSGLQNKKTSHYTDEEIYTMACKAAVKAHKKLSDFEIQELLKRLAALENSGTCPHGRPITVSIPKHELERRFKRCL